ncbi:hypothetical protein E4U24_004375 [Claviceps purpurea]|nr:hypothetical protein E4U11_007085 [Claviceps purpurea]KAG6245495.1 hypothetical protein E4U24_004375 [Claviceps purpurea]
MTMLSPQREQLSVVGLIVDLEPRPPAVISDHHHDGDDETGLDYDSTSVSDELQRVPDMHLGRKTGKYCLNVPAAPIVPYRLGVEVLGTTYGVEQ